MADPTKAVDDFVKRNMTSDPEATKRGAGIMAKTIADALPAGGVSLQNPLGGFGAEAMKAMFPYGLEGSVTQRERAVKEGLTASGQPLPADMSERLMQDKINKQAGVGTALTRSDITAQAEKAVPVATVENAPAAAAGINGQPWSRERRMEELNLNEGRIERGIGPGGTDVLTNRNTPFKDYKVLPEEAAGSPEAQVRKNLTELATGRGPGALKAAGILMGGKAQEEQANIEREKMAQSAQQFAANKDMKNVENQRDFLMKFGGYTENEVLDVEGNKTTVRTPNMDILKEAFDDDGNINVQKALKGVEDNKSINNAKAVLSKENAPVVRKMLLDGGVPAHKIDQLFKSKGL